MWFDQLCIASESVELQRRMERLAVAAPEPLPRGELAARQVSTVQQAMSANDSCAREIAQLIVNYQNVVYVPNRTKDWESTRLLARVLQAPAPQGAAHPDEGDPLGSLRACVEETQEVRVTGDLLQHRPDAADRWMQAASVVRDLVVSALILDIPQDLKYYKYDIVGVEILPNQPKKPPEPIFRPITPHAVIEFLRALHHRDLEHVEINAFMLAPVQAVKEDAHRTQLNNEFFRGLEISLFARAPNLTSLTILCERNRWDLPTLQFPPGLKRIEVRDWDPSAGVKEAWTKTAAAPGREVLFTETPRRRRSVIDTGIDTMWGLNV